MAEEHGDADHRQHQIHHHNAPCPSPATAAAVSPRLLRRPIEVPSAAATSRPQTSGAAQLARRVATQPQSWAAAPRVHTSFDLEHLARPAQKLRHGELKLASSKREPLQGHGCSISPRTAAMLLDARAHGQAVGTLGFFQPLDLLVAPAPSPNALPAPRPHPGCAPTVRRAHGRGGLTVHPRTACDCASAHGACLGTGGDEMAAGPPPAPLAVTRSPLLANFRYNVAQHGNDGSQRPVSAFRPRPRLRVAVLPGPREPELAGEPEPEPRHEQH
jgi:hypothetical protein